MSTHPGIATPRGMSLVEIIVASGVLIFVSLGLLMALHTNTVTTEESISFAAAARAARDKFSEVSSRGWNDIPTFYSRVSNRFFKVYLSSPVPGSANAGRVLSARNALLPAMIAIDHSANADALFANSQATAALYAGEVVVITSEQVTNAAIGLDGVTRISLPIDLNSNGTSNDANQTGSSPLTVNPPPTRYLVGVIIRWDLPTGQERYEAWNVVDKF